MRKLLLAIAVTSLAGSNVMQAQQLPNANFDGE